MNTNNRIKTSVATLFALIAFAANSVLCRMALDKNLIDAGNFTSIRLLSGIVVLFALIKLTRQPKKITEKPTPNGSWLATSMLFTYAVTFSYGYISLDTGTGALVLFGAVQMTMIIASMLSGHKLHWSEWAGLALSFSGFVYLITPSLTAPSLTGFLLMSVSGIAWGLYSLLGKASVNPLNDTAHNFLCTTPFVIVLAIFAFNQANMTSVGVVLAVLSGGVASGIGYFIWYIALSGLSVTQAAAVQLLVPIIAASGGVLFAGELITLRLVESSVLVLGGILIVILGRRYILTSRLR